MTHAYHLTSPVLILFISIFQVCHARIVLPIACLATQMHHANFVTTTMLTAQTQTYVCLNLVLRVHNTMILPMGNVSIVATIACYAETTNNV